MAQHSQTAMRCSYIVHRHSSSPSSRLPSQENLSQLYICVLKSKSIKSGTHLAHSLVNAIMHVKYIHEIMQERVRDLQSSAS